MTIELSLSKHVGQFPEGAGAFADAVSDVLVIATLLQQRLQEHLDTLGPAGKWRCDPYTGELELRGHTFAAQMLGSCASSWLFAWANRKLAIPDAMTTCSRALGEVGTRIGLSALRTAHLVGDAVNAHTMSMLAIGHGLASAYYVCVFPANHAPYLILDPIPARWPRLYELQRACTDALATDLIVDGLRSLRHAAVTMGLELVPSAAGFTIEDGGDTLDVSLDKRQRISGFRSNVRL